VGRAAAAGVDGEPWHHARRDPGARARAIGVEIRDAQGLATRVLWARVYPEVRSDGSLWLITNEVGIGSLRLPRAVLDEEWIARGPFVPEALAQDASFRELLRVLRGEAPALRLAALRLDGGRRVRILEIGPVSHGATMMQMRTEAVKRP
jgi:hypothetical protein